MYRKSTQNQYPNAILDLNVPTQRFLSYLVFNSSNTYQTARLNQS